jgi:hypothetical protein
MTNQKKSSGKNDIHLLFWGAGGVAQVIEYLLCKCKVWSSNPDPTKKKKKLLFFA